MSFFGTKVLIIRRRIGFSSYNFKHCVTVEKHALEKKTLLLRYDDCKKGSLKAIAVVKLRKSFHKKVGRLYCETFKERPREARRGRHTTAHKKVK